MIRVAKAVVRCRLCQMLVCRVFRVETPSLELLGGSAIETLRAHHVRPDSEAAQRPRWWTKPSQYLNLVCIYPNLLLRFPQRGMQEGFIGRVEFSTWET